MALELRSPKALSILKSAEGFFDLGDFEHAWELLEDLPSEAKTSKEVLHLRLQILLRQGMAKGWFHGGKPDPMR